MLLMFILLLHIRLMMLVILMKWQVLHNIAVAEYFRDGCTDPQKLLDVLEKVKGPDRGAHPDQRRGESRVRSGAPWHTRVHQSPHLRTRCGMRPRSKEMQCSKLHLVVVPNAFGID
eukprot:Gb_09405 [translate_table: standard]